MCEYVFFITWITFFEDLQILRTDFMNVIHEDNIHVVSVLVFSFSFLPEICKHLLIEQKYWF